MSNTLRDFLADNRDVIVARFVDEVRGKELPPEGIPVSLLRDHIPLFLDEVVDELDQVASVRISREVNDQSAAARRHGQQRFTLGYDLEGLVREYGVLRHVILDLARQSGAVPSFDEFDVFAKCLSVGVAQAASEYVRYRDLLFEGQRVRLQFLAEAGELLSSSLDYRSTLARLTELVVPRLADWCAVHLEDGTVDDMPIAHVDPAKVDIVREIYRRYPIPSDAPYGSQHVVQTNQPQLMQKIDPAFLEAAAKDAEHLEMLRTLDACSWMILPLRVQATAFGALTFVYSESKRHYDDVDLVFGGELARRAALAIHNARLFEQSQQARSRLEAERRTKDEFVSVLSHELRTPLNAILGWTRMLRGGRLAASKQAQALEIIERNALSQTQRVADLLDISAATTGKTRIDLRSVDFAAIVQRAIDTVLPAAEAKGIEVETKLDALDTPVRGDEARLLQATWIVLSNAVKFSERQTRIAIRLRADESDVELTVEDQGIGIDAEFLPHVFESFRQYDGSITRPHGGLGVGLSIAKHLIELHGGTIDVRSEGLGKGAAFRIRLPTGRPSIHDSLRGQGHGVSVLVVDGDGEARELSAEIFQAQGMKVYTAEDAGAAIHLLEVATPDVLVADLALPVVDGVAFMRAVRGSSAPYKNIPAIALTVRSDRDERARAIEVGFSLHFTKPAQPDALVNAVLQLVEAPR